MLRTCLQVAPTVLTGRLECWGREVQILGDDVEEHLPDVVSLLYLLHDPVVQAGDLRLEELVLGLEELVLRLEMDLLRVVLVCVASARREGEDRQAAEDGGGDDGGGDDPLGDLGEHLERARHGVFVGHENISLSCVSGNELPCANPNGSAVNKQALKLNGYLLTTDHIVKEHISYNLG